MGLSRAQIIDQDPGRAPLFYKDLRDVDFLIFQPAFWGREGQSARKGTQAEEWERKKQAPDGEAR